MQQETFKGGGAQKHQKCTGRAGRAVGNSRCQETAFSGNHSGEGF